MTVLDITVVAAVIEQDGKLLLTRRLEGTHLAGLWEFPGGKSEQGEGHIECLERELREELGVEATVGEEILSTAHTYADRRVTLHFRACTIAGTPRPLIGQEIRWVQREDLRTLEFPAADAALIDALAGRPSV
jgi:mutator protein MutT